MALGAFIFLIIFISINCELLAGSANFIIPFSALSIFYISIMAGWKRGLLLAVITGTAVDILYGRTILLTPYLMMLTVAAGIFWLHKGDPVSILPHLIPGSVIALIVSLPLLAVDSYHTGIYLINLYKLAVTAFAGSLILPAMIAFFDFLAEKQGLPLYRKAKAVVMDQKRQNRS